MRYWQRRLFWAWLLSGGSTNYGGRWWTVHPYTTTGTRTATYHGRPNFTFRTALTGLDSVRPIRDYFERRGIDLGQFVPDHALVEDADGRKAAQAPRLMRRGNDEFLVYHPHAAADEQAAHVTADTTARLWLDLRNAPGTFSVEWYRAEDGRSQTDADGSGGDRRELAAPWAGADVVVRLLHKQSVTTTLGAKAVRNTKARIHLRPCAESGFVMGSGVPELEWSAYSSFWRDFLAS
jgi:hypothetical protein